MTEAENRIQEYLEGVKRSLSEQVAKAQAEMEKKIPEAKNEQIEAAINELWQELQATNNKLTELIEVERQKVSLLPALPRKRHKKQLCLSNYSSIERQNQQLQPLNIEAKNKKTQLMEVEKQKVQMQPVQTRSKQKRQMPVEVDLTNPFVDRFLIQGNKITYKGIKYKWHQILLDVLIRKKKFVFSVDIVQTKGGFITVGVVDRLTQRAARNSAKSSNSVGYNCRSGIIFYRHNGRKYTKLTGETLSEGMQIRVEVNLQKGSVCFLLIKGTQEEHLQQKSDILSQANREFVPCIEMYYPEDSIRWHIQ